MVIEHFTFEMYSPERKGDVLLMKRIQHQFAGPQITRSDLMKEFVKFLDACGYE